jgi:hypothetical protein
MSRFFVGQRVRKVRGMMAIGTTGSVIGVGLWNDFRPEATMKVRVDMPAMGFGGLFSAGEEAFTDPADWEPILLARHEACDAEFKRDLDAMLDKVKERA